VTLSPDEATGALRDMAAVETRSQRGGGALILAGCCSARCKMEQPDPVIHQPLRLKIMAALNGLPRGERLEFVRVRAILNAAEGNLSAHLGTLNKAGYIKVEKNFNGRRPRTWISLTGTGARAYGDYAAYLRAKFPDWIEQGWGTAISATNLEPNSAPGPEFRRSLARIERLGASPASMIALVRMNHQIDVREIFRRYVRRHWCCITPATRVSAPKPDATSVALFPVRNISSCWAMTAGQTSRRTTGSLTRSRNG